MEKICIVCGESFECKRISKVYCSPKCSMKKYYEDNKDVIKVYQENNKDKLKEQRKERDEKNKDKIKEHQKGYYLKNKDIIKEQRKEYYKNNQDKIKDQSKEYRKNNQDKIKEYCKEYHLSNQDKRNEYAKEYHLNNKDKRKEYRINNKDKRNKYCRNKRRSDPILKLSETCRTRLSKFLKQRGYKKTSKSFEMIGCSPIKLKEHIEAQFKEGMNWGNYNLYTWHIDHRIPLCSANTKEEVIKLCHYSNLQPLWAEENLSKGGRLDSK